MKKIVVEKEASIRIDQYLTMQDSEMTRSLVQKYINDGIITVNGRSNIKCSYKVKFGDEIEIADVEDKITDILPEDIPLDIIYEDDDITIINKLKGMVGHPGNGNYSATMVNALMYSHKDKLSSINGIIRPGIVHRIDKDTSGLLVVAKNDKAHKVLSDKFKEHDITREYICLVKGIISRDNITIKLPIGRSDKDRKKMTVTNKNAREAITHVHVIQRFKKSGYTLLSVKLETGRTHQIRVHMSHIGYPIVGDNVYSSGKNEFGVEGQMLHARVLGFVHPVKNKYMQWEVAPSKEFEDIIKLLNQREV